jgi:hypothetical protein
MRRSQRGIVLFEVLLAAGILAAASVLLGRMILESTRRVDEAHKSYQATLALSEPLWLFDRAARLAMEPESLPVPESFSATWEGSPEIVIQKALEQRPLRITWPQTGTRHESLRLGFYKRHAE